MLYVKEEPRNVLNFIIELRLVALKLREDLETNTIEL